MIYEFGLSNFKPFHAEQEARFSPITLIYGPNSGGKSSIIQALMLLRQTFDAKTPDSTRLNPRGDLVDLGSFKSLVFRHDLDLPVVFRVGFGPVAPNDYRTFPALPAPRDSNRQVTLTYQATSSIESKKRDTSVLSMVRYRIAAKEGASMLDVELARGQDSRQEQLDLMPLGLKAMQSTYVFSSPDDNIRSLMSYFRELDRRRAARQQSRQLQGEAKQQSDGDGTKDGDELEALESFLATCSVVGDGGLPARLFPSDRAVAVSPAFRGIRYRVLEGIAHEFHNLVNSFSYLGPLRMSPARHYVSYDTGAETVGKQGEHAPQLLHRERRTLEQRINTWFERFEIPYELTISEVGDEITGGIITIALKDTRTKVTVGPADVGFGIGQLLPVLVEGVVAEDRIVCVEQPEIHLHPRLQAHLADFLIETSGVSRPSDSRRGDISRNQWVIETHSEALILRLQRRIREGVIKPDAVSVIYVLPTENGARILQLRLDQEGEFIDEWPDGFFEDGFYEVFGGRKR